MIGEHAANGYYLIYPKARGVIAYGPIIPGADFESLSEAHAYVDDVGLGALAEVRYLYPDKNLIHSAMYMPEVGYGDAQIPASHDGLVNLRKVELLKMPMSLQSQILWECLKGVVDDETIDRIDALYRMNIPLSVEYLKLLEDNAVYGTISEDGIFKRDASKERSSNHKLQIHMDGWFLDSKPEHSTASLEP